MYGVHHLAEVGVESINQSFHIASLGHLLGERCKATNVAHQDHHIHQLSTQQFICFFWLVGDLGCNCG